MFGYIRYDFPNLFIKDFTLYRAIYCGVCKGIAKTCGQRARMGLSYDMAFLSALLHNIKGVDVVIERQHCFEHLLSRRAIAVADELTCQIGAINVILTYYKLTDDIADGDRGRGKRLWFKKGFARAKKKYPKLVQIVKDCLAAQDGVERAQTASLDGAAENTARMMELLSDELLGEKSSEHTKKLFYSIGKWIYLIDGLDDYDKDKKKGAYNPFVLSYQSESLSALMQERGAEVSFVFDTLFYAMRESLSHIPFAFNRDLTDNIILRGIPCETLRVMKGEKREKDIKKI